MVLVLVLAAVVIVGVESRGFGLIDNVDVKGRVTLLVSADTKKLVRRCRVLGTEYLVVKVLGAVRWKLENPACGSRNVALDVP